MPVMKLYSPRPTATAVLDERGAAGSAGFAGKSFAIVDHGGLQWGTGDSIATVLRDRLLEQGAADVEILHWEEFSVLAPPEYFDDIAARVAGAVTGLGQ